MLKDNNRTLSGNPNFLSIEFMTNLKHQLKSFSGLIEEATIVLLSRRIILKASSNSNLFIDLKEPFLDNIFTFYRILNLMLYTKTCKRLVVVLMSVRWKIVHVISFGISKLNVNVVIQCNLSTWSAQFQFEQCLGNISHF